MDQPTVNGTLALTNQLGMRITVPITSSDDAYRIMRQMGRRGWTSGEIPPGGLILPFAMADTFDWSLIGAREFEYDAVEDGVATKKRAVSYRGMTYKRRECPARKAGGISYPDMVKYSRGAKAFDGDEGREGDSDGIQYVTLVTFRGNASPIPEFCRPQAGTARASVN